MASQKGGGVSFGLLIGVIVCVFIIGGLIYVAVSQNGLYHKEVEKVAQAQLEVEEARKKELDANRKYQDLSELVHGSRDPVNRDLIVRDYLKVASAKLRETLEQEKLSSEQVGKDLNKDGKLAEKEYKFLTEIYADLFIELNATLPELNRLRSEKVAALAEVEAARATARKEKSELEEQLEKERKEKGDLNAKLLEDAKAYDAEKQRLLAEKKQVADEMAQKEEERLIAEARLESKIRELESRIVQMEEKKKRSLADTDADGEIVHADQRLGLAWVNIGRNQRVRRGTVFDVFQYVKGGVKKHKGKVEIRALDDDRAQVAILSQSDISDPVVKGDFIASPFYDGRKSMVFVFVGEKLSTRSRYSMDELIRRIEETGGRVDKQITIDTDFAIAIEGAEQNEEFQKAVQFGVVIMREHELLDYIGR
jgi:hypothetical protein